MLKKEFKQSIQSKFLGDIFLILFLGTVVLSTVIALNERKMLRHALITKGQNFAFYIAKLSQDPMIMKDNILLDSYVNEANKAEDIIYTIIQDAQGNIITSQYASINYRSPKLKAILSELTKKSELQDIIAVIRKSGAVTELSAPIVTGGDIIGKVTIGISENKVRLQMIQTIVSVVILNLLIALVLGAILFVTSKKILLTPIADLAAAAARLAKGDLATQVTVKATGELQMLVDSFNRMAADLNTTTVSKKALQTILDSMPYGVVIIGMDKRIIDANYSALSLMGYDHEEHIEGMICNKTLCPAEEGKCPILDLKQTVDNSERILVTKDGRHIPILKTVVPMELGGENVLLEAFVDISEHKETEEELKLSSEKLKQSNQELQDFLSTASHHLQEPLRKIQTFSGIMKTEFSGTLRKEGVDYLNRMQNAAKLMQTLLSNLTDFSKITTKAQPFVSTDLGIVLKEALLDLEAHIQQQQGVVEAENLPVIDADSLQMRQLFQNLICNALKFHKEGESPIIKISAQIFKEQRLADSLFEELCQICIEDNGIGFDKKYSDKIFGVFQMLHSKDEYGGTGMGLTICKKIAERHGGAITARSAPGQGAVFIVTLPVKH